MLSQDANFVQLGPRRWELGGKYLKLLESCNECLLSEDVGLALRNQLNEKGYIYLQHVLPQEEVLKAKLTGKMILLNVDRKINMTLKVFYFSS